MGNIVLIGFRGTGKSTLGKRLAKKLGMGFVDTDELICEETGMSIPKIFEEKGEEWFRRVEEKIVSRVCELDNFCIACGGGVVLSKSNVEKLRKNSKVILLKSSPKVIFNRIRGDANRPALTKKEELFDEIRFLLSERKNFYESAADFVVDTSRKGVNSCVKEIIDWLNCVGFL